MKPLLPSLAILLCVCFVQAGEDKSDLDRFQGTWEVVSLSEKGKDVPKAELDILVVAVEKDTLSVSEKGKVVVQYRLKLDRSKTPKEIDFTHLIGENKDKTEPGIYVFDKDVLKMVLNEDSKDRPTVFEGKETASYSVIVLKKKAKD